MAPLHSFASVAVGATMVAAAPCPLAQRDAPAVPQYVIDNAPLVKMTSGEPYQPADISAQISNAHPQLNSTNIDTSALPSPLDANNLDSLNSVANSNNGAFVYLASNDDFNANPPPTYLLGTTPDSDGTTQNAVSSAIIINDHQNGTVDAFYMYFYAFDNGPSVFNSGPLGSHVGDWEHNMIRFVNEKPSAIWYSEHSNGEAFSWSALGLQFQGSRPISYCANGTHANYATSGTHAYAIPDVPLPDGPLEDHTDDSGALWDPTKSAWFYTVTFPEGTASGDSSSPSFTAANAGVSPGSAPTAWLNYIGQWGDAQLSNDDKRQSSWFGQKHYVGGPTGPRDKQLNRANVCPSNGIDCIVRDVVTPGS